MLLYKFIPESDHDIVPEVTLNFKEADDLDIYEHLENFKYFLKALSFTEDTIDKIQIVDNEKKDI